MANDPSVFVRQAIVTTLTGAGMTNVHGPMPPSVVQWPFTRVEVVDALPLWAALLDGARVSFRVNCFARNGDERTASAMAALAARTLDRAVITLVDAPYPASIRRLSWDGTTTTRDRDDASAWHSMARFTAWVSASPA